MPQTIKSLSLPEADIVIAAAIAAAEATPVKSTIVVLDAGGEIIVATRMDGAWAGAFDLALAKARTSRAFGAPSGYFTALVQPGAPLFGVGSAEGGKYLTLPGGVPVILGGAVIGAIGVSGGTPDQDEAVAQAALRRLHLPDATVAA
ncbi:GlcG/HbpS family heme-binding protein [Sphingomonas kyeonggiensis]|uniref:Uncharacterized protein GlcG (DUF336 family) n=1 Tax=Sphingomonas kyeonggiensis TaxID=1268553 RepID=A0A7W6NVE0_9SPHN|nr:heme-binding protein [Sphingomonas kyeonggiensis]MBB4097984.1 uncharacterized protein GlcG (DUF336 family) [Sphingomonas kyeonggiensis]